MRKNVTGSFALASALLTGCTQTGQRAATEDNQGEARKGFFDAGLRTPNAALRQAQRSERVSWGQGASLVAHTGADAAPQSHAAATAMAYLHANADALGLPEAAIDASYVAHVHDTGRGAIVVKLKQRVADYDVVRTSLSIVMDRNLSIVATSGSLHPAASNQLTAAQARQLEGSARQLEQASIARVFDDMERPREQLELAEATPDGGGFIRYESLAAESKVVGNARAKRVLFPVGTELVAAVETDIALRATNSEKLEGMRHVFSADGQLLLRVSTSADVAYNYRVWADADGKPTDGPHVDTTPHPTGRPEHMLPGFLQPILIAVEGFNRSTPTGRPDPWLAPDATDLTGNNVVAYADIDPYNGLTFGDVTTEPTGPFTFDRTYNVALDPRANVEQIKAATTQLFYTVNWLHDFWYDSGFNESAGNAQIDNYGRGGYGNDPILAEAQDGGGTDNANMYTPADGAPPRMQMYRWNGPAGTVMRDGTLDNAIVAHEFGHYWHHRLVDCGATACASMSEGFGDFSALMMVANAGDNLHGSYGLTSYAGASGTTTTRNLSTYFGIRRYPYSTNLAINPLTFNHIQRYVEIPAAAPARFQSDNAEVHNAGEVWCAALWDAFVAIVDQSNGPNPRFTFDEGKRRFADYMVAGLLATPVEPTYTEQRDAILAAIAASDPVDYELAAKAFARRGFGSSATPPPVSAPDARPTREDYSVKGMLAVKQVTLREADAACDADGFLDRGETGLLEVTIHNPGAAPLAAPSVAVSTNTRGLRIVGTPAQTVGPLAPGATAQVTYTVQLDEAGQDLERAHVTIVLDDATAAFRNLRGSAVLPINHDATASASNIESFAAERPNWTTTGWSRTTSHANAALAWMSATPGPSSDATLISPPIMVASDRNFTLTLSHRFLFDQSPSANFDGGVVEYTDDDGATWHDLAALGTTRFYNGTITNNDNALAGRPAFVASSPAYPGMSTSTLDTGTALAGKTIRLRLRLASDQRAGVSGWDIDELRVDGTSQTPFATVSAETGDCLIGQRPVANAGADQTVAPGATVSLDGTASVNGVGNAGTLRYQWRQVAGPEVNARSLDTAAPTFVAPAVSEPVVLRFELTVSSEGLRTSLADSVLIRVDAPPAALTPVAPAPAPVVATPPAPPAPAAATAPSEPLSSTGGCMSPSAASLWPLALLALARRRRRDR